MKVLVVEDERKIADSIKRGLELDKMTCDVAYDGDLGLDMASTGDYDLLILDLMLPGMDGLKITKNLRELKIDTPILILTAKGEIDDRVIGLNSGADDYLVKPFAFEELVARIKALLRRPKKTISNIINFKNLEIDTLNKVVKQDNQIVEVSKKEYQILEFFIKNPGKTISKEDLIAKVWDYDSDILPNTVEVFIKYLRAKIGHSIIKTVRGFGYKLS